MRQVKAREAAVKRSTRAGGRPKGARPRDGRGQRGGTRQQSLDLEPRPFSWRDSILFRFPMLTLTVVLMVGGVIAGIIAGGHIGKLGALIDASVMHELADAGYSVKHRPITGNQRTPSDELATMLGVDGDTPIFAVDTARARARVLTLPWVADAEIKRAFPDTVSLHVIEKRPFALWQSGKDLFVVERSGAIIVKAEPESFRLPVLAGAGAPEAAATLIDALGAYKALGARVKIIERVGERRWDLVLDGGVTAKLPEEGWEAQLAVLETLIADKDILDKNIEIIDLRYPDNYVFRLHNGDSRPMPRGQHV